MTPCVVIKQAFFRSSLLKNLGFGQVKQQDYVVFHNTHTRLRMSKPGCLAGLAVCVFKNSV